MESKQKTHRLIGLFLMGCLLFNFPILSLFNVNEFLLGIPLLYLYIFSAWAILIVSIGLIMRQAAER